MEVHPHINNLSSGEYEVLITDDNGCIEVASFLLNNNSENIDISSYVTPAIAIITMVISKLTQVVLLHIHIVGVIIVLLTLFSIFLPEFIQ